MVVLPKYCSRKAELGHDDFEICAGALPAVAQSAKAVLHDKSSKEVGTVL